MQSAASRIWTRAAVSISYNDNYYTIGTYQVLPLQARVDLGAMAIKGYSTFPKVSALLEPHN